MKKETSQINSKNNRGETSGNKELGGKGIVSKILIFRSNTKLLSRSELKFREYLLVSSNRKKKKLKAISDLGKNFILKLLFTLQ